MSALKVILDIVMVFFSLHIAANAGNLKHIYTHNYICILSILKVSCITLATPCMQLKQIYLVSLVMGEGLG